MRPDPHTDLDELASAATPTIARVAGGAVMLAGLDCAITGAQFWGFVLSCALVVAPFLGLALGLGAIAVGFQLQRGRGWASIAAVLWALVLAAGGAAWALYGLSNGYVSLMALALPPVAGIALFLAAFAIEPARRVSRVRQRLQQQGLGLGV